ncbi:MAG: hypothetical protein ABS77_05340 [Phenylobacterium sp. SCN 69-14]|nr:MAG: hypothetical protein ABS77_05340 [Phenylobacterium sp. SCN 69-14]
MFGPLGIFDAANHSNGSLGSFGAGEIHEHVVQAAVAAQSQEALGWLFIPTRPCAFILRIDVEIIGAGQNLLCVLQTGSAADAQHIIRRGSFGGVLPLNSRARDLVLDVCQRPARRLDFSAGLWSYGGAIALLFIL